MLEKTKSSVGREKSGKKTQRIKMKGGYVAYIKNSRKVRKVREVFNITLRSLRSLRLNIFYGGLRPRPGKVFGCGE